MNQSKQIFFWLTAALIITAGCDGNDLPYFGNGQEEIYSGQFLDSAVANLDYSSSTQSGTTDATGRFKYQKNESVTFSVGGVTLGTAPGRAIVTPLNLVSNSTSSTPEVQNITRFLLALDRDDDPRNGITISPAVKSVAKNWPSIDFSASDFDSLVTALLSEAGSVDGRTAQMPAPAEATEHLERTIFCAYGGGFSGIFSSASSRGEWMLVVDEEGIIAGVGKDSSGTGFRLEGRMNADSDGSFRADFYPDNATQSTTQWEGNIYPSGSIIGSWNNSSSGEITSLAGNRKILAVPAGTKGEIYKGILQLGDVTIDGDFTIKNNLIDVGIILLIIDGNTLNGKGFLYSENIEFNIPDILFTGGGFSFDAAGKQFIGRVEGNTITLGTKDLATQNIGGGIACKNP